MNATDFFTSTHTRATAEPKVKERAPPGTARRSLTSEAPRLDPSLEIFFDWILYLRAKPFDAGRSREYGLDVVSCFDGTLGQGDNAPFTAIVPYRPFLPVRPATSAPSFSSPTSAFPQSYSSKLDCVSVFAPFSKMVPLLSHSALRWSQGKFNEIGISFSADMDRDELIRAEIKRLRQLNRKSERVKQRLSNASVSSEEDSDLPAFRSVLLDRVETLFWDSSYGSSVGCSVPRMHDLIISVRAY